MSEARSIHLNLAIERKDPALPRFVVVPAAAIAHLHLSGTTVVIGTVNGVSFGRQTIKPWDQDRWFITITEALCRKAGVDTGDKVRIAFQVAPDEMPAELETILRDPSAAANWNGLTAAQQRMLREEILALKSPAARERRAAQHLLGR